MAKAKLYVDFKISPSSDYISIEGMFIAPELESEYKAHEGIMKSLGVVKYECIKGFELKYLLIDVKYDGRSRKISNDDILNSFESAGLATKKGSSIFGGFYKPTEKLKSTMESQLKKRKGLAGV